MKEFEDWQIILASSSPRRQELLEKIGLKPTIIKPQFDEYPHPGEAADHYVLRNAEGKAQSCLVNAPADVSCLLIAADTVVVLDGKILEKPKDRCEAIKMVSSLAGTTHHVYTGVAINCLEHGCEKSKRSGLVTTTVQLGSLSLTEIEAYCDTDEPYDKAGGYAMQGQAAYMVRSITGSPSNVIGLPLLETINWMRELITI